MSPLAQAQASGDAEQALAPFGRSPGWPDEDKSDCDGHDIIVLYVPQLNDSVDRISTPFSGPRGDYKGAVHRAEYADAHTGYIKVHIIKAETVFLPNGLCTLFGPVSARRADAGIAATIQQGQFFSPARAEVLVYCLWRLCPQPGTSLYLELLPRFCGWCTVDRCAEAVQRCDEVRTHHRGEKLRNGEQPFLHWRDKGWLQNRK